MVQSIGKDDSSLHVKTISSCSHLYGYKQLGMAAILPLYWLKMHTLLCLLAIFPSPSHAFSVDVNPMN